MNQCKLAHLSAEIQLGHTLIFMPQAKGVLTQIFSVIVFLRQMVGPKSLENVPVSVSAP